MTPLLFVLAESDLEGQNPTRAYSDGEGDTWMAAEVAGVLPILPFVMSDPTLNANSRSLLLDPQQGTGRPRNLPANTRLNVFNLVGDPDASPTTLRSIQSFVTHTGPLRCFNRPERVFRTSRSALPETLAGIPGCVVPETKQAHPKDPVELRDACDRFGHWPLIIRARGYHGGVNMVLIEDREQLDTIGDLGWLYQGVNLIQFVDFRGGNGLYQKWRVMLVDGKPYPRHAVLSDNWCIHGESRTALMEADAALRREEERSLAWLRDQGLKRFASIFRQMYERIGLDIFGVDFAIVDEQLVVFEANACMNFLVERRADQRYAYLEDYTRVLRRAVKKMLVQA